MTVETTEKHSRRVGIILPDDVYQRAKEAAKNERRSFSNYIAALLDRAAANKEREQREAEQITNAA